jgi:PAS domain S-box-containing protein
MNPKPTSVLLLDDDPNLRGVLSDILKMKGFEIVPVSTGKAAIDHISGQSFEVALIDIKLDDMSGLDVLHDIKTISPTTECIMLTGHASQDTAIEAINLGAYSYFQKPYEVDQLLVAIQRAAEKHLAGHALQESEARFRSLIENSTDLIAILNPDSTLRYVSPSIKRIMGYPTVDVIGRTKLHDYIHPEDFPSFMETFRLCLQASDSTPFYMQLRMLHMDGTWRTLEGTGSNLLAHPAIEGIIVNARDVTERIKTEEKVRESEERYRSLFENVPNGVYRSTMDGKFISVNPALLGIFGYSSAEELLSVDIARDLYIRPEDRLSWVTALSQKGELHNVETPMQRKDHQEIVVLENTQVIFDDNGKALFLEGTLTDITDLKQAEQALRRSESSLQAVLQSTVDGILAVGLENEVLYASDRFVELWRIPAQVMSSKDDSVLLNYVLDQLNDPQGFLKQVQELYRSKAESFDTLYFKDGRVFERLSRPLLQGTQLTGRVWSFRDVTARRQDEKLQDAVYRIAQAADRADGPEALYPAIHTIIQEVMIADNFYIAIHDQENDLLSYPYFVDEVDSPAPPQKLGKGMTEFVLRSARSVLCTEALYDDLISRGEVELVGVHSPIWLGVPLIVTGKAIGVMALQDYQNPNAYGERELHMLEFVSSQVAMAIHRKQAEVQITNSEAELRALFASMQDVVLVIDRDGVYQKIAPTNPGLLAKPPAQLLGKNLWDIFPPDQAESFIRSVQGVLQTKQTTHIEYDLTISDQIISFEASISPMSMDSTLWVARDITARKKAEDRLRRLNECFLKFGADPLANINLLVAFTGEVFGATCALYNQLQGNMLSSLSTWNTPPDYRSLDSSKGHICTDVINSNNDDFVIIRNLQNSPYALTDPNIYQYQLQTYFGKPVRFEKSNVGSLCVVFQNDLIPGDDDQRLLGIIASAMGVEEKRKREALLKDTLYQVLSAVSTQLDSDHVVRSAVETIVQITGYPHVCFAIPDESGTQWVVRGAAGSLAAELGASYPIHYGVIGRTFFTGQSQWVRDILEDPDYLRDVKVEAAPDLRSEFVTLVQRGGHLFGALNFESDRVDAFDDADVRMIQSVADVIALALENAQSFDDAQQEITRRRQAEDIIRQAEARYHSIVEQVPAIFYTEDLDHKVLFVSSKIETILGFSPQEWMSAPGFWKDSVHPDDILEVAAEDLNTNQSGEPFQREYRVFRKDGRMVWIRDQASLVKDGDTPLFWQGVMYDISSEKESEASLRASEERYRMLAENMSDMVWLMDLGLHTTYISPSVSRLRGFNLDEINTIPLDRQMPPDSLQRALKLFANILSTENLVQFSQSNSRTIELEYYKKDGTKYWSENTFTLVRDTSGNPFAILGSGRDISESKKAQITLQDSEKYFRALIENNTDAVVMLDPRGMILYESPAFSRMVGRAPGHRLGMSSYENIHYQDKSLVAQMLADLVQHPGGIRQTTFRLQHRDGSWRWIEATATNLLGESAIHGLVVNMHDITDRKRSEAVLQRHLQELTLLQTVSNHAVTAQSEDDLIEQTTNLIGQTFYPDNFGFLLLDTASGVLRVHPSYRGGNEAPVLIVHLGEGITGQVAMDGKTRRIGDVRKVEKYIQVFPAARAELAVPLKVGERILGVINAESHELNAFSEDDERLLTTLAGQVANAIERQRSRNSGQRRLSELEVLFDNSLSISGFLEPRKIAQKMIEVLSEKLDWHHTSIRLYHRETGLIEILALNEPGLDPEQRKTEISRLEKIFTTLDIGLSGWVIKHRQTIRSGNVQADERYHSTFPDIRSGMYVPLIIGKHATGCIAVESRQADRFTEDDERLLQTLAVQSAIAFENARLYQQAVTAAKRKEALHQGGLEIVRAGQDINALCLAVHNAARQVIPAEAFTVSLISADGVEVEAPYLYDRGIIHPNTRLPASAGVTGRVIKSKKPLRIKDVLKTKGPKPIMVDGVEPTRSILSVPLLAQDKIIGVLSAQSWEPDVYNFEDQVFLETLASEAAVAFENARLFEETRRRLAELESLSQVSISLTSAIDLQPLLENILAGARKAIPAAEKGSILLIGQDGTLHLQALSGYSDPRLNGLSLPEEIGYAARVARERIPIRIDDVHEEYDIPYQGSIEEIDAVQSGIAAPMIVKGKVIGVLSLDNASRKAAFSESDLRLLVTFASSVAVAIENARLFTETQQRLHRLTALHSIDAAIGASVDTQVTLSIVLEHVISELKADAAAVLLFNPLTRMLEYASGRGFRFHVIEGLRLRLGESLAGQSALQRRSINISDLRLTDEVKVWMQPGSTYISSPLQYMEGEEFIGYHAIPLIAKGQVQGVLEIFKRTPMPVDQEWITFFEMLAGQTAIAVDNGYLFQNLQRSNLELTLAYDATIQGWSQALELRDQETEGHTLRVTDLTLRLFQAMGIDEAESEHARRGSLLHDIGKIAVPDKILLKPGPLDAEELIVMRRHTQFAYDLLAPISYLRPALTIPYCHHEKWDGSGYPRGLKGEEIPIAARIFSVADVYDALTSIRPYRHAWTREKAMDYIREQSGVHFDPLVVKTFLALLTGEN